MSIAVWPSQVPYEQLREGAGSPVLATPPVVSETEGGPSLMRPRPGPVATEISWRSVPWCGAEYQAFQQFMLQTLYRGTQVFKVPVYKPGEGYVTRICQIKGGAGGVALDESLAPLFSVAFTLIVFNW